MKRPILRRLYIYLLRKMRHAGFREIYRKETLDSAKTLGPKVVVIGGGTGLSNMLRGLKRYTENITAVVTVADDGGGSGMLREELGMLPPGDIRNCILALANVEPMMLELLNYRFTDGVNRGQSFGNLFLAALNGVCGSFEEAVARMNEVLAVTGRVLPVTGTNVNLEAVFEDGSTIIGESKICSHKKSHNCRISEVRLNPEKPEALKGALDAIYSADLIVLGPGSLYTSIIPNLLVNGITEALKNSSAPKLYVLNIMTQDGETEGYSAFDHVKALMKHSDEGIINMCLFNSEPVQPVLQEKYRSEDAEPVTVQADKEKFASAGIEIYGYPLISNKTDYARHDPDLLARAIMCIFTDYCHREGIFGAYDTLIINENA